jgi:hypothetical protein
MNSTKIFSGDQSWKYAAENDVSEISSISIIRIRVDVAPDGEPWVINQHWRGSSPYKIFVNLFDVKVSYLTKLTVVSALIHNSKKVCMYYNV